MTAALEGGEWSAARPGRTLLPGKTRYPFYRRLRPILVVLNDTVDRWLLSVCVGTLWMSLASWEFILCDTGPITVGILQRKYIVIWRNFFIAKSLYFSTAITLYFICPVNEKNSTGSYKYEYLIMCLMAWNVARLWITVPVRRWQNNWE